MIVMKFGGTSVGSAANIRKVLALVREALPRGPVVVASAFRGVTDMLLDLAKRAVLEDVELDALEKRHADVVRELGVRPDIVAAEIEELRDLLRGIRLVKELTPRSLDYVGSFGERMSVRIIAEFFRASGLPAVALNAGEIGLVTDSRFTRARPLPEAYDEIPKARDWAGSSEVPIVTGFIGRDRDGNVTTLGRNGSDYSASIVGAALRAEEIEIWTDVDGVMTADPRVVPDAALIAEMSFEEASEVAYYGAKVLHPATILPAVRNNIPVRVCNTNNPSCPGTLILKDTRAAAAGPVRALAAKSGITLINIVSSRMLAQHGFLAKVFEIFGRHEIVIDVIATSEVSISVTTDTPHHLHEAVRELQQFSDVTVDGSRAILCVVGKGMKGAIGVAGRVFQALAGEKINVEMISMAAAQINISMLVAAREADAAVRALHRTFFGAAAR